jgi:hypothetical protein
VSRDLARQTGISAKPLASLILCSAGVWLVPSGIALHFASHDGATVWAHLFMSAHNAASLAFLAGAAIHVVMNWKTLTHYVRARMDDAARYRRELLIAVLGVSVLVLFAASHAFHAH